MVLGSNLEDLFQYSALGVALSGSFAGSQFFFSYCSEFKLYSLICMFTKIGWMARTVYDAGMLVSKDILKLCTQMLLFLFFLIILVL